MVLIQWRKFFIGNSDQSVFQIQCARGFLFSEKSVFEEDITGVFRKKCVGNIQCQVNYRKVSAFLETKSTKNRS